MDALGLILPARPFLSNARKGSNMKLKLNALVMALGLISGSVHAVNTCGGETSTGNPLPCCDNGGNCTWWGYKKAKDAGWLSIPTGNANTWDNTALASPAYSISTTPSSGAIGVKESSPYTCTKNGKVVKNGCDTGHIAYVTDLVKDAKGNVTNVNTSQMACGGAYGATNVTRTLGYFDKYITRVDLNNKASTLCTDGAVAGTSKDASGNTLSLYYSATCKTNWAVVKAKSNTALVSATVTNKNNSATRSQNGIGSAMTTMVETGSAVPACANAKVGTVSLPQVCK